MALILIIEDEPILAEDMREGLEQAGHEVTVTASGEDGLDAAQQRPHDVTLLDLRLPGIDGMEVLKALRDRGDLTSVIIITAHGDVKTAVDAMKMGAADFLLKPVDADELQIIIKRVTQQRRAADNLNYFRQRQREGGTFDDVIGDSPAIKRVKNVITKLTSTSALSSDIPPSVLLTGETGTGKDLFARAIHFAGPRSAAPFVHVNCTALPEHLVESELFGHVKGAFTDARTDRRGLFEVADGGTVFLNEIGHMPPSLQAKLLGTLEHRTIRPVGGSRERRVNVHLIAATNRDLEDAVESNQFREDLYHRLRVVQIELPPLRDRPEDIAQLAEHFLAVYANRFGLDARGISTDALNLMRGYDWPGNVRELSHVIESAVLISDGPNIRPEHLNIKSSDASGGLQVDVAGRPPIVVDFGGDGPKLEEIEYRIIKATLEHCKYNLSRAARILGISRDAVRYRIDRFERGSDQEKASA